MSSAPSRSANTRIATLAHLLEEAWAGPAWHGPSLRQAIRSLSPDVAVVRPAGAAHSAWSIMLHAAYWKHRVTCRVLDRPRERFPLKPANFPAAPAKPDERRWRDDVGLVEECHVDLVHALEAFEDRRLDRRCGHWTVEESFRGAALHDVYHAGQIQLLRRQVKAR